MRPRAASGGSALDRWVAALAVSALLLAAACAPRETPAPVDADTPRPGGELVFAVQDEARSLDPHLVNDAASMRVIENLYSTLLRYAEEYGEVEPDLLAAYEVSDDGLVYELTLRPDATFADSGRPVTAADVEYSIERIVDHQVRAQHFAAIDGIEVVGDHRLRIRLAEPMAPFLTYLAHPMNAIVDRRAVEEAGGDLRRRAAGSGPFRLAAWRIDQSIVLERHDGYHLEARPFLDRVVFRPISDETARTTALRNREVDLVADVAPRDIETLEGAPGVAVESVPGTFWEYLGLNTRRDPLADPRVRRAIAWAVDRDALNRMVKLGQAIPLRGGLIPPSHWAHAGLELYPRRDLERARELLAEAGLEDGFEMVLKVGSAFPYQVAAAQVIKQQLGEIGVDTEILPLESSVLFDALGQGDFDSTVVGWVGFVDPDEWTFNLFHTQGMWNQQGYSNSRVDEMLERGRRVRGRQERRAIYAEAQEIIVREAPMVLLYVNPQSSAYLEEVRGYRVHATAATLALRDTWLAR